LASVGLPLTNSFIGEFLLLLGVFQYNYIAAGIGGLTIILSAVYMFRMFQRVMLGKTNEVTVNFADLHWNEKVVLWILVIVIIAAGIYPQPILAIAEPALRIILDNAVLN
jgi:NADH-quinone oxidoreductase subunit M